MAEREPLDSAKHCAILGVGPEISGSSPMTEQLPLFTRKKFSATLTQGIPITPPGPASSVLSTIPAYYVYLQSQGYSPYTPADFCGDVKKFGLFVHQKALEKITTQDLQQFVSDLRTKERLTEKTISRKLTALTNYFTWLAKEKVVSHNPALTIYNAKITSPLPDILFDAECTKLLEAASKDSRTYLLVLLLVETGMKTEEVRHLELAHIDTSNAYAPEVYIKHTGKKVKKDRKLKLPREFATVLAEYTTTYQIVDRLFPYTPRMLQYLLASAGERAGLKKRVTAQLLRDTCAVRLIKSEESMETVLKKLGLSETTWEDAKVKYGKLTSRAL